MFKQISQRTASRSFVNSNKIATAVSRFQTAKLHDFTIKLNFPVENVAELKQKVETMGEHVVTTDFDVTYFDNVPKEFRKGESSGVAEGKEVYTLTKQDIWLRRLNGSWHCASPHVDTKGKTHLNDKPDDRVPHYDEHNTDKEIRRLLNLQQDLTREAREGVKLAELEEDLKTRMGVVPFASFKYQQDTYSLPDHFVLDIFKADFGYTFAQLQTIVRNGNDITVADRCNALHQIMTNLKKNPEDLSTSYTKSLILEYIARTNPEHYKTLENLEIVPK